MSSKKFSKTQSEKENHETTQVKGDWQIGCKDIKMRMVNLYYSDSWTDCIFLVRGEQKVSAHKVVLASASPVFAAMFYGGMPEKGDSIQIDDIEPDTFIEMLRYIYTDNTDIISTNDACALYYAAKKYMLLHLKTECVEYLLKNVTAADCCLVYEFALMFEEKNLISACEKIMVDNTKEVLASTDFLTASIKTVHFIYSLNEMAIKSESVLFKALQCYLSSNDKCEKSCGILKNNEDTITQSKTENWNGTTKQENNLNGNLIECVQPTKPELKNNNDVIVTAIKEHKEIMKDSEPELTATTRDVLKLIRFLTMSAEEFTNLPATSTLLTPQEQLYILNNIINHSKSTVPMPEGFSTELVKRCIKEDLRSRKVVEFKFKVPECELLLPKDIIYFPQVHCVKRSWIISLNLVSKDTCQVLMSGNGPRHEGYSLRLRVFTKKGAEKIFRFTSHGDYEERENEEARYIPWNDLLDNYLEEGALNFEVKIEPHSEINF